MNRHTKKKCDSGLKKKEKKKVVYIYIVVLFFQSLDYIYLIICAYPFFVWM